MIENYVKASLRKFRRAKVHTAINAVGLLLGLLCAIIIFQKVRYELSFDVYHADVERLYRVVHENTQFGGSEYHEGVPYPFVEAFRIDFPEVEAVTIVDRNFGNDPVLSVRRNSGEEVRAKEGTGIAFVDPDFFDIFDYEWVRGAPATAMAAPRSVVLSESMAEKYFGQEDPMGRTLTIDATRDVTVTGIVKDPPTNTVLPLRMLVSYNLGESGRRGNDNWNSTSTSVQVYAKLSPGMAPSAVERQMPTFIARHRDAETAAHFNYFLQPLKEIHFDARFNAMEEQAIVDRGTLWALSLIGLFLLVTACINFINMNVVLVFKRAREVGVRKALGGTPRQIVAYFMTETALVTGLAVVLALVLVNPVMALARPFIGEGFGANPFLDPALAGFALAAAVVLTLCSGLYPAYLLSRLEPTAALRNRVGQRPGAYLSLRRSLVVVQFAISQLLIICTLVTMAQMRYLYEVPLGYDTEALVEFDLPERDVTRFATLKNQLSQVSDVYSVSFSNSGATSGSVWGTNFHFEKEGERFENETQIKLVDADYVDTYGFELVAGAQPPRADSITGVIVNEAFVRLMGLASPAEAVGVPVSAWMAEGTPITGVVRDFNTQSLHEAVKPTILVPSTADRYAYLGAARINTHRLEDALAAVEQAWTQAFPEYVFEYTFLDDRIADFYEREQTTRQLIQAFALVAILIGCIGLFGLISYMTSQRAREVGIRKVLGASTPHIVGLFTREFAAFVVLGFVLSAPVAYFAMQRWLEDFAYRVDLGAGLFFIAFAVALLIALMTVGFKTYHAAVANPVDAIRRD